MPGLLIAGIDAPTIQQCRLASIVTLLLIEALINRLSAGREQNHETFVP